jgi:hypothetical protein
MFNYHHRDLWAENNNPYACYAANHQCQLSINEWAGIIRDDLLAPFTM